MRFGIFIHVPKTAGCTVMATLKEAGAVVYAPGHRVLEGHKEFVYKKCGKLGAWEAAYKFSFVRNPWDRMVSYYYHTVAAKRQKWDDSRHHDEFRNWLHAKGARSILDHGAQVSICNWKHESQVDFIGQYEHLARDFAVVAREMGVGPDSLALNNFGKHRPTRVWQPYYDQRAHDLIKGMCHWEIARFKYGFEDEPSSEPTERPLPGLI
jgi:hypothetical protein